MPKKPERKSKGMEKDGKYLSNKKSNNCYYDVQVQPHAKHLS